VWAPPNDRGRQPPASPWARAALTGLLLLGSARAAEWPLTGALFVHDPSILEEEGQWWVFSTGPGLRVKHSVDGRHWTQEKPLFSQEPAWWRTYAPNMGPLDVWAPDVHRFRDRCWCYYSVSEFATNHSAIGLLSCTSLAKGDWRDDGFVLSSVSPADARSLSNPERRNSPAGEPWFNAIDPNLTTDREGSPWLVFGSWFDGIHVVPLDPVTMKPAGPSTALAYKPRGIEAPNIVYHDGYFFLFVSIDKCCQGAKSTYKVSYGRSREITGPYLDRAGSPLLEGGGSILVAGGPRWRGPGGQTVYHAPGGWIMVYHAYDAEHDGVPTLKISDLFWDPGNWPTLEGPGK